VYQGGIYLYYWPSRGSKGSVCTIIFKVELPIGFLGTFVNIIGKASFLEDAKFQYLHYYGVQWVVHTNISLYLDFLVTDP